MADVHIILSGVGSSNHGRSGCLRSNLPWEGPGQVVWHGYVRRIPLHGLRRGRDFCRSHYLVGISDSHKSDNRGTLQTAADPAARALALDSFEPKSISLIEQEITKITEGEWIADR